MCGIVHGQKTRKFFAKLVRLGLASVYDCRHNRARIYHLDQKALYRAIGQAESRLRRPLTLGHAIDRLMVLDAIIEPPDLVWLGTAEEKAAHLTALTAINPVDLPHLTIGEGDKRTTRYFPERLPIGVHRDGRVVLLAYGIAVHANRARERRESEGRPNTPPIQTSNIAAELAYRSSLRIIGTPIARHLHNA